MIREIPKTDSLTSRFKELEVTVKTTPGLSEFVDHYLQTLLWSENVSLSQDSALVPADSLFTVENLDLPGKFFVFESCIKFWASANELIDEENFAGEYIQQAGHDFCLTRNGHGAGFWDGDWAEPAASQLTKMSEAAGTESLFAYEADPGSEFVNDEGFALSVV